MHILFYLSLSAPVQYVVAHTAPVKDLQSQSIARVFFNICREHPTRKSRELFGKHLVQYSSMRYF